MPKDLQQTISPATLFSRITDWFDNDEWNYDTYGDNEEKSLTANVSCDNGKWRIIVKANEELREIYFWSMLNINVPEDRRMAVSEFFTRVNYSRRIGFFEMDWRDGEVRFNVSFSVADGVLTDGQIKKAVDDVLNGMDRYFVPLMSVVYGGQEPDTALAEMRKTKVSATDSTELEAVSAAVH